MRSSKAFALFPACLLGLVKASPAPRGLANCAIPHFPVFKSGNPSGEMNPVAITFASGREDYKCDQRTHTYALTKTTGTLFDASCVANIVYVEATSVLAFTASFFALVASTTHANATVSGKLGTKDGFPLFDFSQDSEKGNPAAFVVTEFPSSAPLPVDPPLSPIPASSTTSGVPSPTSSPATETMTYYKRKEGDLASIVGSFKFVRSSQPTTCDAAIAGSTSTSLPFNAVYVFYNS